MNDELKRSIEEIEKTEEIFEPDIYGLEHITDFDSYDARLKDALADYEAACRAFRAADPNKRLIMKAAEAVEMTAKVLVARVSVIFHMPDATVEKRMEGREILDRICKDANIREQDCSQYYYAVADKYPEQTEYLAGLMIEKQARMNFLNRCMATQNHYLNDGIKRNDYGQAREESEKRCSAAAARIRSRVPDGHMFLPPRIFPHDPVPEGKPVPKRPEPYLRVAALDVEHKEYDLEHDNFVVKKGYVSEDGMIDDQSVIWDYENNKVTIKFRGGEPVVWDFWKPKDTADVLGPDHWCVQYMQRSYRQLEEASEPGLFRRK